MEVTPFLDKVAAHIAGHYAGRYDSLCVVLPNRRAGLFLKKYLSLKIDQPVWLPAIYSIEDFIMHLSGYKLADQLTLLFELYRVHCAVEKDQAQPFDEFLHWGKVLLRDFNEIDAYLLDPAALFSYLSDAKALAVWNLDRRPLTDFQKQYLAFYRSLLTYYNLLVENITRQNLAYEGLAARRLAGTIASRSTTLSWQHILFCGFNALTKAEETIIGHLVDAGIAEVKWDADRYYTENPLQEAGLFIRKYRDDKRFGAFEWLDDTLATTGKQITVTGIPQNIGQVKVAGELIKELVDGGVPKSELHHTAVVLCEEDLLIPMLNSLPSNIGEFNVTMGYPLKFTPVYDLFEAIFTLHDNAAKFYNMPSSSSFKFYYKDVLKILNHPYVLTLSDDIPATRRTIAGLQQSGRVFFTARELEEMFTSEAAAYYGAVRSIFRDWRELASEAMSCLTALLEALRDKLIITNARGQHNGIELEYVFHFARIVTRLRTLMDEHGFLSTTPVLRSVFRQLVGGTTIPFYGEPLKGLQVMGMLETRTLDFENLIMLSVNEDIIPSSKTTMTFIPYDICREFALPTYRERHAVYAYHFYRLLQRSRNIYLLYNTEAGELGGGDRSRFITQIIHELPRHNPSVTITEKLLNMPPGKDHRFYKIVIDKDNAIITKLDALAVRGLAPSTLNTYRNCSLRFYFQEIAGLSEAEEVEETIEAATIGTVVHEVMKMLYEPLAGKSLTPEKIREMLPLIDNYVTASFHRNYKGGDINYGKNLLIANVAKLFVRNYLLRETEFIEAGAKEGRTLTIRSVEEMLKTMITLRVDGTDKPVLLKGKADRIDRIDGLYRIIDYKTGMVRKGDLNVDSMESLKKDLKADKSFQLLVYAYIFLLEDAGKEQEVLPGIISFRKPSQGLITVALPGNAPLNRESLRTFGTIVHDLLRGIFDGHTPFTQTTEREYCKYCPFTVTCNR